MKTAFKSSMLKGFSFCQVVISLFLIHQSVHADPLVEIKADLEVYNTISDSDDGVIIADETAMAAGVGGQLVFYGNYLTAGSQTTAGSIRAEKANGTSGNYAFDMVFKSREHGQSTPTERVRITNDGNVGIGTSAPTYMLEIQDGAGAQNIIRAKRSGEDIFVLKADSNEYAVMTLYYGNGTTKGVELNTAGDSFLNTGYDFSINTTSAVDTLTVTDNGAIALEGTGFTPGTDSDFGKVYAKRSGDVEVFVKNENGDVTQLSSHANPERFDTTFDSSFDDPEIDLPFSFHHSNQFIGKGAVVDMAALIKDVGQLTGKNYTAVYDVTPEEVVDYQPWREDQRQKMEQRAKERIISESPEIEVPISEALEMVEILEKVVGVQEVTKYRIDYETAQIIEYTTDELVVSLVPTGEFEYRLKPDYRFDEYMGKIYRPRTTDDVEVDPISEPTLPDWILSRLPQE